MFTNSILSAASDNSTAPAAEVEPPTNLVTPEIPTRPPPSPPFQLANFFAEIPDSDSDESFEGSDDESESSSDPDDVPALEDISDDEDDGPEEHRALNTLNKEVCSLISFIAAKN